LQYIDIISALGAKLLTVEKPARYVGGEYGVLASREKMEQAHLRAAMVFPDLYEIGMSNRAFRIVYNRLNALPGIACDRAFAPAPDFEKLLAENNIPLYGLDSGIVLADVDILCFTLGYELGITGIFSVLKSAGIPLRCAERGEGGPFIVMGGPCVSNPLPYAPFVDAFWVGEAEAGFFELCQNSFSQRHKGTKEGSGQSEKSALPSIRENFLNHPNVWMKGKAGVRRAVWGGFADSEEAAVFPVSNIKTVQHHGAVEIMRGCPNGCRFCHAGVWYRPMRQKNARLIQNEVKEAVEKGGYREVSLSSLSSGDYQHLGELLDALNAEYGPARISFQLPSLRVSGFSLDILEKISEVRKSGLTFAVETACDLWQKEVNKIVAKDEVLAILAEAKKRGWKGAKFYFMLGLPLKNENGDSISLKEEAEAVVRFVADAGKQSRSHFSINIGAFIPKAQTTYQYAAQAREGEAREALQFVKDSLKPLGHKVSYHDTFISEIEGIFARGDERAGELACAAFEAGARLDAWTEFFNAEIWKKIFAENAAYIDEVLSGEVWKKVSGAIVSAGVSHHYLDEESKKSCAALLSPPCAEDCANPCGACGNNARVAKNDANPEYVFSTCSGSVPPAAETYRMLFAFEKKGKAIFTPHLGVIEVFAMALRRAKIPVSFSEGFNPHPRLEFASPAPLGVVCLADPCCAELDEKMSAAEFVSAVNLHLPSGFAVVRAELFAVPRGAKKHTLPSLLSGFMYGGEFVPEREEKSYRASHAGGGFLTRNEVLAICIGGHEDYFSAYKRLYI
jgi:radical SAM family uncharacterized protein